jgi:hypothetical protein
VKCELKQENGDERTAWRKRLFREGGESKYKENMGELETLTL